MHVARLGVLRPAVHGGHRTFADEAGELESTCDRLTNQRGVTHRKGPLYLVFLLAEDGLQDGAGALDRRSLRVERQAAEAACGRLYASPPQAEGERRVRGKKAIVSR